MRFVAGESVKGRLSLGRGVGNNERRICIALEYAQYTADGKQVTPSYTQLNSM